MDKSTTGGPPGFVLNTLKTSCPAANAGKFVELFISNPAQPLHFVSSASRFVQYCLEQKPYCRNLAKAPSASNRVSIPVLLDVAGRDNE